MVDKYNPEWISIDIMGENFGIESGDVYHNCIPFEWPVSLELAFVITGEPGIPPPPEPHEGDINLHNIDGYIPDPTGMHPLLGTEWQELWPNFDEYWDMTSWFDNGDGILSVCDYIDITSPTNPSAWRKFHVTWVGPTITVLYDVDTFYLEYICHDYATMEPIYEPVGTWWHEKWPTYSYRWYITGWVDNGNGYLDYCDYIDIYNWDTQETITVHVEGVDTDLLADEIIPVPPDPLPDGTHMHNIHDWRPPYGEPFGTWWHELRPNYCTMWELTSWFDNGDGMLSICDYVDFTSIERQEWKKFHVEWVGPTIRVVPSEGVDSLYLDYVGYDLPTVGNITTPVGTYWHEVMPNYCTNYYVVGCTDNGNQVLDSCDFLILQNLETGEFEEYHVTEYSTDVILSEVIPPDPLPEGINLHNPTGWRPDASSPIDTYWHELYPHYCADRVLTSWIDNGDGILSVCDTVDFNYNTDSLYHVEWVGPTLVLWNWDDPSQDSIHYMEYIGWDNPFVHPISNMLGTFWWEIYPNYCTQHVCVAWYDNTNGYVDSCDVIILQDMATGDYKEYHVKRVETDMIVSVGVCDCVPGDCDGLPGYNMLDILYLIAYLYKGGPAPVPYAICSGDADCNCRTDMLDILYLIAYLYKGGPPPCTCQQWLAACGPPLRK